MKTPSMMIFAFALGLPAAAAAQATSGFDAASSTWLEANTAAQPQAPAAGMASYTDMLTNCSFLVNSKDQTVQKYDITKRELSKFVPLAETQDAVVIAYNNFRNRQPKILTAAGLTAASASFGSAPTRDVLVEGAPMFRSASISGAPSAPIQEAPTGSAPGSPIAVAPAPSGAADAPRTQTLNHTMGSASTPDASAASNAEALGTNIGAWYKSNAAGSEPGTSGPGSTTASGRGLPARPGSMDGTALNDPSSIVLTHRVLVGVQARSNATYRTTREALEDGEYSADSPGVDHPAKPFSSTPNDETAR
jgi:hypothetical protein